MAHPDAHKPYDTAVVVPASIRAGASRADELIALAQAEVRGEAPPANTPPPPALQPDGKDAQPPAPPPPSPPTQPTPQPPQTSPAPPQAPQQLAPEEWEQRYKTLKGRRDAELASSQQAIGELQRQINEMQQRLQAPPAPAPAPANFDEEDDATWGPDFRMAVQRRVDAAVTQVEQRLSGRVQQVEHVAQAGTEGALRAALDRIMPMWNDVNYDPEFHAWLRLPDEMSGVTRQQLVNKAWAERDAERVARFFNSFLSGAVPPPAGSQAVATQPAPNGEHPPASQRLSLTDLAAPGLARPAAAAQPQGAPTAKRFWTSTDIGQFYAAKNKGLYDRTPELRSLCAEYEADIYAAQAENRVR